MASTVYPSVYQQLNKQRTKRPNVVVQFAGISTIFSVVPIYQKIRYGDPRIKYGQPGLVYGGLIAVDGVEPILMLDGGLNISQRIEPEQGRGSVATLTLKFVDKDGIMTKLIAENSLVPEPLVNVLVTVSLGFVNSSFPEDYYKVFRGYITNITSGTGWVSLQLSDANVKRRQTIFLGGTTTLLSNINNSTTTIPANNTSGFIQQILGPNSTYDSSVTTYIKIDDEYMVYDHAGISGPQQFTVTRGARGSSAGPHTAGASITNCIQLEGNVIDLALKIMMSGWNGSWLTGVPVNCLGTSLDPTNVQTNSIVFPSGTDVIDEYGITPGDYITISGSTAGNNGTYVIESIQNDLGDQNLMVIVDRPLTIENPATSVRLAFRSQYDTFPVSCGLKNTPQDVDVMTHQSVRQLLFSSGIYTNQVMIQDTQNGQPGKDLIEGTLWLPAGIYTITRYGRVSISVTLPPIASSTLTYLDQTNILDPKTITIQRATNTRRFYNVIQFNYDLNDAGSYQSQTILLDETSANPIDIESILPINADGVKSTLGGNTMVQQRGLFILNRYKKAAFELTLKINWSVASQLEVGDIVAVADNGQLQISNLETGVRDLGTQLFEVIERSLDIKSGNATVTLLSNTGYQINQRYATISPSSIVAAGSSNNAIEIQDSYGPLFPGNERKKWNPLVGLPIIVHDQLWTQSATAVLTGFSPADNYRMQVSPALPFIPAPGDIVDIVNYGTGTDPNYNSLYKTLYAFIDPTVTVTSGTDHTHFSVSLSDAQVLNIGQPVIVHTPSYSQVSPQSKVTNVNTGTGAVTVATDLTFTPASGMLVEMIGFKDGGSPYLIL